jgi:demethoxyubiquinone hydroxylase (CLK1/Coq7/Cat5 family)
MKTTEKEFDAVKFMRQQRDRLSAQLSKMTKEEIVAYFRKKATETTVRPAQS